MNAYLNFPEPQEKDSFSIINDKEMQQMFETLAWKTTVTIAGLSKKLATDYLLLF